MSRAGLTAALRAWWAGRPWRKAEPPLLYGIVDPDFARAFTIIRCIAWSHGYSAMMHGSFTRDLDVILVPWTEHAIEFERLFTLIEHATGLRRLGDKPVQKLHGRLAWSLMFPGIGDPRWVDVSAMPRQVGAKP